jgi:hypothetical protein
MGSNIMEFMNIISIITQRGNAPLRLFTPTLVNGRIACIPLIASSSPTFLLLSADSSQLHYHFVSHRIILLYSSLRSSVYCPVGFVCEVVAYLSQKKPCYSSPSAAAIDRLIRPISTFIYTL